MGAAPPQAPGSGPVWPLELCLRGTGGIRAAAVSVAPTTRRVILGFMDYPTGHFWFEGVPEGSFLGLWTTRRAIFGFMDYPTAHFWFDGLPEGSFLVLWTTRRAIWGFMDYPTGHVWFCGLPDGAFWVFLDYPTGHFSFWDDPSGHFLFFGLPDGSFWGTWRNAHSGYLLFQSGLEWVVSKQGDLSKQGNLPPIGTRQLPV